MTVCVREGRPRLRKTTFLMVPVGFPEGFMEFDGECSYKESVIENGLEADTELV